MPIFNTSNPFKSSSSSATQSSARRGPPRKGTGPSSSSNTSQRRPQQPPPPDPRLVSLSQLDSLTSRLKELKSSFIQPHFLDFNPKSSTPEQPKLEYNPNNAPFHAYDEALTKFLIELDGIDSCGQDEIRSRRKALVLEVEKELERLDVVKKEEYKKQQGGGQRAESEKEQKSESRGSDQTSQARQPLNSVNSDQPQTNQSQPTFPPGLPLPPRDYPASNSSRQSPHDYASQYANGLSPPPPLSSSSAKRPSDSPQRPPQAHRGPPPTSAAALNSNNPYRQPPPYDAEPRYAPQPQTGAKYTSNDPYAAQGRVEQHQRRY
ncbi:hypothetical protein JCM5353_004842 [Sporobolomyces roseus]